MYQHKSTPNHVIGSRKSISSKPKRPLTCYGVFSVLERNYIWQHNQKADPPNASNAACIDPYAATRPERYRGVVLPSNWFVVGMNRKKRSEYKNQSKISFQELSRTIAERWRSVDMETKIYCELIAANELERYRGDMAVYEETHTKKCNKATTTQAEKSSPCRAPLKECRCNSADDSYSRCTHNKFDAYVKRTNDKEAGLFCGECVPGAISNVITSQPGQLSDYLPDDRREALELVGYNYENILAGEELQRAFDEDESCPRDDVTYPLRANEATLTSRKRTSISGQHHQLEYPHVSSFVSLLDPERQQTPETSTLSSVSFASSRTSSDTQSMFGAFRLWYNGEGRS
ncbi:hypothetical protein ACHAWX_007393 [Stephanocyclus meneghinianus]